LSSFIRDHAKSRKDEIAKFLEDYSLSPEGLILNDDSKTVGLHLGQEYIGVFSHDYECRWYDFQYSKKYLHLIRFDDCLGSEFRKYAFIEA
jgi:hypothetical protein